MENAEQISLQYAFACIFFKEVQFENGFSPLYVRMWHIKDVFIENVDPETSQNGFSPVCVLMWPFKWEFVENADPEILQKYGFSLVIAWVFSKWTWLKMLIHRLYKKIVFASAYSHVTFQMEISGKF